MGKSHGLFRRGQKKKGEFELPQGTAWSDEDRACLRKDALLETMETQLEEI